MPTSLIPLAEVMNDHRLFLPYIGLVVSVCWALHLALQCAIQPCRGQRRFLRLTTAVILAAARQPMPTAPTSGTAVWHTEETLWRDVTQKSPGNGRGFMNYGLALMAKGDYAGAER